MTPPPDAVAALRDVFWSDEAEAPNDPAEMYRRLTAAGWSLSHESEREALVAAEARVAVLVEAIPEDPWMTEGPIEYRCYAPSCRARVVSGHHPDEEGWSVADHERECEWVTARAALRGQR